MLSRHVRMFDIFSSCDALTPLKPVAFHSICTWLLHHSTCGTYTQSPCAHRTIDALCNGTTHVSPLCKRMQCRHQDPWRLCVVCARFARCEVHCRFGCRPRSIVWHTIVIISGLVVPICVCCIIPIRKVLFVKFNGVVCAVSWLVAHDAAR